ncbi:conserved hypothetical protein [Theileria equi strain WA]|uniref:Uncharacterized protein n=1 Tax=Theileria equi strain WA TaxID=1537102 RepID=L1LCZ2_THEEQ|nr:conserved hypothetical protein [Theileria equi strain WA]EKX73282.1 conserved hypothetical protein [Theileria equi strain WA]|eukprot:XP_004832734.1 conserved hypothetical protein [Theileria equi strain WA]
MMKQWFKSKVSEIGEKAVDSVVNIILSRNESSISQFQQTPLMNAITKSVNSKVQVKQPNVLQCERGESLSICKVQVLVSEAIFLLLPDATITHKYYANSPHDATPLSVQSNLRFSKPVVDDRRGRLHFATVGSVKANLCTYRISIDHNGKSFVSNSIGMEEDSMNRVIWDYSIEDDLHDIWSDIVITLTSELDTNKYMTERIADVSPKSQFKSFQPRKMSNSQFPSLYLSRNIGDESAKEASDSPVDHDINPDFIDDPPEVDKYNLKCSKKIGRAIISIPLILSSFPTENRSNIVSDVKYFKRYVTSQIGESAEKVEVLPAENGGYVTRCTFWLQLLPLNEHKWDEFKFVRPYSGCPTYGMRNPSNSIGYILVTVNLHWNSNPVQLSLLNNIVAPNHKWVVPHDLEVFHISAIADRFRLFFTRKPKWVDKLLMPDSEPDSHSYLDIFFIVAFWLLLFNLVVIAPLTKLPLGAYLLTLVTSLYYKFSPEVSYPKYKGSCLVGGHVLSLEESIVFNTGTDAKRDVRPLSDIRGEKGDAENKQAKHPAQEAVGNESSPENMPSFGANDEQGQNETDVTGGELEQLDASVTLSKMETNNLKQGNRVEDSIVKDPFGSTHLNLTRGYARQPIFSDDMDDVNMSEVVKRACNAARIVQIILGYTIMFAEKLRFSLTWNYPASSFLTFFILSVGLLPITVLFYVISLVPLWMWRALTFMTIMLLCLHQHIFVVFEGIYSIAEPLVDLGKNSKVAKLGYSQHTLDFGIKATTDIVSRYCINWFNRMPGQLEVDHRDIAALQSSGSLCSLLPSNYTIHWDFYKKNLKHSFDILESNQPDPKAYAKAKSHIERAILEDYLLHSN